MRSRSLGLSYLDGTELYTTAIKEVRFLIRVAKEFVKSPNMPTTFQARTFYTSAKMFSGKKRAVIGDYQADVASKFVGFLNTPMCHTHMTDIFLLLMFFSCMCLHSYNPRSKTGV